MMTIVNPLVEESKIGMMEAGAVTMIDVLGWKGIWQRKSDAMKTLGEIKNLVGSLLESELGELEAKIWGFSDTIILATYGESDKVLPSHANMAYLLLNFCLEEKLPIRGAIGYGQFSHMENMLVGPAVDEVASWYEAVEWIGAILTPTASFQDFSADNVVKYAVPLGSGRKYTTKCVNWIDSSLADEKKLLQKLRDTTFVVTPDLALKYQNTVEFFRYVRKLKESKRAELL